MELTQHILGYITKQGSVTTGQVVAMSGTTKRTTYRHLNRLVSEGKIVRQGVPPSVVYALAKAATPLEYGENGDKKTSFVNNDYIAPVRTQVSAEADNSPKGLVMLLAVVALLSVGLFALSLRNKGGGNSNPAAPSAQAGNMYTAILRYDVNTAQYYVLDSMNNRVALDVDDTASLKRLVGKTIQLPPAFLEWADEADEMELPEQSREIPQPQL